MHIKENKKLKFANNFYKNKRVFITGHTGFKGTWMCKVLTMAGADVMGYALESPTKPSIFRLLNVEDRIISIVGDVRNLEQMNKCFNEFEPEIVIHMAAQPIVRESYKNPVYTYETNIMGTVNILECIRNSSSVRSFINVTTDKVYLNKEWEWGYRENEELNGFDPYSNSKSCSELITSGYNNSFFYDRNVAISTCRAGNVIGGGDFATDRIIPDCIRAIEDNRNIMVRNPFSVRPYQHVLDPIMAYLMIAKAQYENKSLAGCYNVGPNEENCITTGELVDLFCKEWKGQTGEDIKWTNKYDGGPHEANFLKLDCSKIKTKIGWKPIWGIEITMQKIVEWTECYLHNGDINKCTEKQIVEFCDNM